MERVSTEAVLKVENLTIAFPGEKEKQTVVQDVSFSVGQGEIVGIVGESGSGKSLTALAAMGLLRPEAQVQGGAIYLNGENLLKLDIKMLRRMQGSQMGMIFQEPMTSLNPVMRIGYQVGESLILHQEPSRPLSPEAIRSRVLKALSEVGLSDPESVYEQYPHELSGGMRQRVMIALAMIGHPRLLIADEPTTALDVVVQAQILDLLRKLNQAKGIAILFISHDLHVIRRLCQRVLVMYQGSLVEEGTVQQVLESPSHEYTKTLVQRLPGSLLPAAREKKLLSLQGFSVYYREQRAGAWGKSRRRKVVSGVNLEVYEGEILGIVGESGCGKSTLAKAIVGLNRDVEGTMQLATEVPPQMVFQDPFGALNPAHTIGWILAEPLRAAGVRDKKQRRHMVCQMLVDIGLDESFYGRYARELSGGQRQRVSIGAALLRKSKLLVADEPVSALDVTVQSQIIALLLEMHQRHGLSLIFISHDLQLVRHMCHRVAVMYNGEIVEQGEAKAVYENPQHPYTKRLWEAGQ